MGNEKMEMVVGVSGGSSDCSGPYLSANCFICVPHQLF